MIQSEFLEDDSDISVENILRGRKNVDSDIYYNSHFNTFGSNDDDLGRVRSFAVGMGQ